MEPGYITQAKALLGEKEIAGKLDNPKIIELYADAGHDEIQHDEVPWCAAFVGACLARANLPNTGTLLALDYKNYGVPTEGNQPELYCIGVKTRGSSTWEGHVGFVVAFDDDTVSLLGGNQHDSVCVAKFKRSEFKAFRKPVMKPDKLVSEVVDDSRRLQTQGWFEKIMVSLGLAGGVTWQTLTEVKQFASDHAGMMILGTLVGAWGFSKLISWMSIREYLEGRYLPSKQWK